MTTFDGDWLSPPPTARLSVDGLSAAADAGNRVLYHVSLSVEAGQIHTVLGPPGAGKTTLMHALAGLITVPAGTITVDGRDASRLSVLQRARLGLRLAPQKPRLFPTLTVEAHLALAATAGHDRDIDAIIADLPALTGLRRHRPDQLTAEKAAVLSIACALLGRPRLLLLDEVLYGLSSTTAQAVTALITRSAMAGAGVLATAQNASDVHPRTDRLSYLNHGALTNGPFT